MLSFNAACTSVHSNYKRMVCIENQDDKEKRCNRSEPDNVLFVCKDRSLQGWSLQIEKYETSYYN